MERWQDWALWLLKGPDIVEVVHDGDGEGGEVHLHAGYMRAVVIDYGTTSDHKSGFFVRVCGWDRTGGLEHESDAMGPFTLIGAMLTALSMKEALDEADDAMEAQMSASMPEDAE